MPFRVRNHVNLNRSQSFYEFLETNFGIAVKIEASHDGIELTLLWAVSYFL